MAEAGTVIIGFLCTADSASLPRNKVGKAHAVKADMSE
jgi:hypothetical protein